MTRDDSVKHYENRVSDDNRVLAATRPELRKRVYLDQSMYHNRACLRNAGIKAGTPICSGAVVAYEGNNGYVALVAEIDLDQATGRVQPRKFTVAVDCGPISNPDGLRNQIEGGILQGMSRALVEQVTWEDRQVTSVDWATYDSLYLGIEVPAIDTILMNRSN
jgi:CO/xanthine dehydrogenase Mo-binding subunit